MWKLIVNAETNAVVSLFEAADDIEIGTPHQIFDCTTRWTALAKIAELGATYADAEPGREISKLAIRRRLRAAGLEEAFDAALDANPQIKADWADAQVICTNDPVMLMTLPQLQQAMSVSDAMLDELLSSD